MVDNVGDSYFDCLIPRFYPPRWTNFLSNWKVRGQKCMKVFISRLFLTIAGRIQDFLLRLLPCSSKFYYKGLYGHISDFELFFLLTWYSLQNWIFLTVSNNYLSLNRKIQAGIRQTWIFRTPLGGLSCSHHMVDNVGRLVLRLANTSFPSTDIKKLSK